MKSKMFKKSLAFILSLALIISAMSCLLLVPAAAAPDYSKLTATFDFDNNGSAADFVQVGGKTGNETATGYESWNYDPEVAEVTGVDRKTIGYSEIVADYEGTLQAVTSKALIAKPYLNNAQTSYVLGNTATGPTPTAYESNLGKTSMFVLKDTVDENGVALDTVKKTRISGKFSLDFYEVDGANNKGWTYIKSSPVLVYYYKDANNWRGIKVNGGYWNQVNPYAFATWQSIVCEDGYIYQSASDAVANATTSTASFYGGSFKDPREFNSRTINGNYASQTAAIWNNKANAHGYYPFLAGAGRASRPAGLNTHERLNFDIEYFDAFVTISISDATGYPLTFMIPEATTYTMYNGTEKKQSSVVDFSSGSFALGASYSIGTNSYRGTNSTNQPRGIFYDDIKVEMTDSGETAVASAISAIDAIADKDSFNTAKAAFENLSDGEKARVTNVATFNKWEAYFSAKRITYDFSEKWQQQALKTTVVGAFVSPLYNLQQDIIADGKDNKVLRLTPFYSNQQNRDARYLDLPAAIVTEAQEAVFEIKGGLHMPGNKLSYDSNAAPGIAELNADFTMTANSAVHKLYMDATGLTKLTAWNIATIHTNLGVDLYQDFKIKFTKVSNTSTKVSFIGTQLVLNEETGLYEAGANTEYESPSYTFGTPINRLALAFGYGVAYDINSIDVKFTGWEEMVGMTADEEALAERIVAIPEITINNYATVNTEVSAIRAAVDALSTTGLAAKVPEGSELTYIEILTAAEAKIAAFTGDVAAAQNFVDTNNAVLNIAKANVTEANAQSIIDVHTAYEALTDAVKSILANNYALLDNAATPGEKCFDIIANLKENYAIAIPLAPTEAQTAFLEHYAANGIGELTAAEGKMDILDASIALYNAVEETHKPNVQAKYDYILKLLDEHFINGNKFTYNRSDVKDYENIYAYLTGTVFTNSTVASDENRTQANKILNPEKFNGTSTTSFKVALDYGKVTQKGYGFNILPNVAVQNLGGGIKNPANYLYTFNYQSKNDIYVDGSTTASGNVDLLWFDGNFANTANQDSSHQFYKGGKSTTFLGTNAFLGGWNTASSQYYCDETTGHYRLPYDRVVYDCEYTVEFNPDFTAANGKNYKRVTITFVGLTVWMEKADDTTPFEYDKTEGSTDYYIGKNAGGQLSYAYSENEIALPQFYTDVTSLGNTQYLEVNREDTFAETYKEELSKTYGTENANEVIELYKNYQALSDSKKAINAEACAKVEAAATAAGLRPVSHGSTLSVGANTSIGFIADKPSFDGYNKFGIIATTYNQMKTNGDKLLTLEDTKVPNNYAKAYAKEYAAGDTRSSQLIFNIVGLFDNGSVDKWGVWLVARYYAVYTAADGTEVTIYSTNDFGNTPESKDDAETAMLNAIAANGQLIRSVNGIIASMATKLYDAKATYANWKGEDYVDGQGAKQSTYTGTTLADAYDDDTDGLLLTAQDTLYLMKAFKSVFTDMAKSDS